jgi:hypothetical protein
MFHMPLLHKAVIGLEQYTPLAAICNILVPSYQSPRRHDPDGPQLLTATDQQLCGP